MSQIWQSVKKRPENGECQVKVKGMIALLLGSILLSGCGQSQAEMQPISQKIVENLRVEDSESAMAYIEYCKDEEVRELFRDYEAATGKDIEETVLHSSDEEIYKMRLDFLSYVATVKEGTVFSY